MICKVTVGDINEKTGHTDFRDLFVASFDELKCLFDEIYADFLQQIGADPYGPEPIDEHSGEVIGGIGVSCRNNFGGHIEVGIGREWWLLTDLTLDESSWVVEENPPDHDFIFFLAGWHYTGIGRDDVISRERCLAAIKMWLDGIAPVGHRSIHGSN